MNWNWEPGRWKKPTKLLLAAATVWPPVYMVIFFLTIFSFMLLIPGKNGGDSNSTDLDVIQLDRKIRAGEIKELTISGDDVRSIDRKSGQIYHTYVTNESTKGEIINEGRGLDAGGRPLIDKIEEKKDQPAPAFLGLGFVALFLVHMLTILLMFALLPVYILLAVKNELLDQTMRIVWIVLFCTLGIFAMPFYWYLHVWRARPLVASMNPS